MCVFYLTTTTTRLRTNYKLKVEGSYGAGRQTFDANMAPIVLKIFWTKNTANDILFKLIKTIKLDFKITDSDF